MRDHPLQLVAGERLDAPPGDADHGVGGRVAGRERVDPLLILEQIDGGDRRPRGDRHLLDDVEHPALVRVGRVRVDRPAVQELGHGMTSPRERGDPVGAPPADQREGGHGHQQEELRLPEQGDVQPARPVLLGEEEGGQDRQVDRRDDRRDGQDEVEDQQRRLLPGGLLVLEEIHGGATLGERRGRHRPRDIDAIRTPPGAPRAPWATRSRRAAAGRKPAKLAMMTVGNVSLWVL